MTTLTSDGFLAVADALGVQTFPTVLALHPSHRDHDRLDAARAGTVAELLDRGVLDAGGDVLDDELTAALRTLARPDRALIMRIRRDGKLIRLCLARRGLDHAVAVRTGDELEVRTVWGDEDPVALAAPLLATLGRCQPADIATLSAPTAELRQRFDDAGSDYAAVAYGLGMPEAAAITLGMVLRHCHSVAELVCYSYRDGSAVRSAATAAVYDTADGRVIGGGSVAADGQAWTTFAPGSDRRLAHVIAAQIESLPEGRWMP
ncbi:ESX secretion-associated protein EspG [Nocardia sp. NPDC046473]|uniref:ESX secretion-associated protein EspG n=1 Tax=Nocardia sp. NPDC046473 TaxID=3155733 RepID=UPI0033E7CF1C